MILRDLRQAAAELLCTERWLADGIRSGRFPAKKINRRWVLGEDDLAAILRICSVNQRTDRFIDDLPGVAATSSMTTTTARRLRQSDRRRPTAKP
jgi:hypothetical protein